MYSLKKVLLTEEIISQRSFVSRLIDLIKKKPKIIGAMSFGSYEQALEFVTDIDEDEEKNVEIDGLKLTSEEAIAYEEMKKEFKEKEDKSLKTLTIKKSKGIKTTERDETPISFNAGIFFKRSKEEKLLSFQERSICLEIIKVDSILGLSSIKDKKSASKAEAVMTKQISKFLNIDGTPINFKAIMPLYDKMLEYIEKSSDVTVDSCIKAADLYVKELYATATPSERQEIDGGNFDFSLVFSRSNYFAKYSETFSNDSSPVIDLYEDEDVKIVYPTSVEAFNKEISSNKIEGGLSWCTQNIGSWQSHHKKHFVAILYDKSIIDDSDPNFIISLKIKYHVDDPYDLIDYEATCDRNNHHMDAASVTSIIDEDVVESLMSSVGKKLKYFVPGYVRKNLKGISETLSGLVRSGRIDIAKEIISKSINFSKQTETADLIRACLSNTSDESERLLLKVIFEIASDSIFYGEYFNSDMSKKILNYDFIYEDVVTNLNSAEFYNILFSLIQDPRAHPKYLIAILRSLDKEILKRFLSAEEIINACKIAFNTNNANSFELVGNETVYSRNGILDILSNENKTKEFFDIVVSSRGFKSRLNNEGTIFHKILVKEIKDTRKNEESSQTSVIDFGFGSIDHFLCVMIIKNKESYLEILEKNNLLDIVIKADQILMKEYIEFSIQNSSKGILSLLDENEVRSDSAYAKQFDGIVSSKEDFENTMLKILKDKEVLEEACSRDDSLYEILLNKSFKTIKFSESDASLEDVRLDVVKFLLESNIEMSNDVISICTGGFDKIYGVYKDIENIPTDFLNRIVENVKEGIRQLGGSHWTLSNLIKKSCFYSLEKREVNFLKMTAKLINLVDSENEVADALFNNADNVGNWGGINKKEVEVLKHNYVNFLLFISSQTKSYLSEIVNKKCGKLLNVADLNRLDIDNLKAARIIVMNGTKRFLNIEQEVYDNIVNNTKRPMTKKEILLNLNILGSENVNLAKSFNKNKVKDIFDNYTKDIKLANSGRFNNTSGLQQALELCIKGFVNLPNCKNMNVNRFYTRELIEAISENYQVLATNYDSKEQENLDKLIVALIENYINFNREGEDVGDAFMSIRSILERANKNSSHIFHSQKFSPTVENAIENIPKDISGSSGNYYQEISKLFNTQDEAPARDNTTDAEVQTEVALRSYIRMLLS